MCMRNLHGKRGNVGVVWRHGHNAAVYNSPIRKGYGQAGGGLHRTRMAAKKRLPVKLPNVTANDKGNE